MPKIITCYKWVLDEQDIKVNPTTLALDTSRAKKKISDYDKNAIEVATQLFEAHGGSSTIISYGGTDLKQSLKDALSRGPEKAIWVSDANAEQADGYVTANVLAEAVKQAGEYDMILCADGSADVCNQQLPARLAALLDVPAITSVVKFEVEGTKVTATRRVGDSTETIIVEGPAVYSVLPEIAQPRFPTVKQLMGASKKPQTEIKVADLGLPEAKLTAKSKVRSITGYVMSRKNMLFKDGSPEELASQVVANLTKEGVL
ncbi:MAG: electron transfer flavoprotein subunit beta/FixA family protein [Sporomusaceae bacterium]|nr:electron transfer flavoprotein subunit beta/FixA family protein [Sporomusaceae bacterium]